MSEQVNQRGQDEHMTNTDEHLEMARAEVKAAVEEWFTDIDLDDMFAVKGWANPLAAEREEAERLRSLWFSENSDAQATLGRVREALAAIENHAHVRQLNSKWERSAGYNDAAKILRGALGMPIRRG